MPRRIQVTLQVLVEQETSVKHTVYALISTFMVCFLQLYAKKYKKNPVHYENRDLPTQV